MPDTAIREHPLARRILWTWDAWVCDPLDADSYVREYCSLIDFMVEWDYNALIVWGFVDNRHGGEESARKLADYAASRGIRLLPGVGAGGYHGFVTSGDSEFSLDRLLQQRPELRAHCRQDPDNPSSQLACLYQQELIDWLRRGANWLASNFAVGGVNIETNEMGGIDICEHAAKATAGEPNRLKYAASYSDLAIAVPAIFDEVRAIHPEAWVTYATYEPAWWKRQEDLRLLEPIPDEAIAQWNMEMDLNADAPPPVAHNVSMIHAGGWSYHLYSFPPIWSFTQYRCFYPDLVLARDFVRNQLAMGLEGFVLGNVGSHKMPDNEIVYIACVEFSRDPELTMEDFCRVFIGRLYGRAAEPQVSQLMLRQTAVHQRVAGVWHWWARLLLGQVIGPMQSADEQSVEALSEQLAIAKAAFDAAEDGGKRRLQIILQVLGEYRAIAQMSRDPRITGLAQSVAEAEGPKRDELIGEISSAAWRVGLPRSIYSHNAT